MEDESDSETFNDKSDLAFDFAEANIPEPSKAEAFNRETCGCTLAEKGKSCSSTITNEEFIHCQNNCTELTLTELDMVLLGTIHSCINCSDMSISGRKETIRKRIRTPFFYHGKQICHLLFLFLHRIRQRGFCSLLLISINCITRKLKPYPKKLLRVISFVFILNKNLFPGINFPPWTINMSEGFQFTTFL